MSSTATPDMLQKSYCQTEFSIREARHIVRDLFEPKPAIYWTDMLASVTVGYVAFTVVGLPGLVWWQRLLAYVVSCLAMYRASLFTHELVHFKSGTFRHFRAVWNLICGVPFLMPSFMYHTHLSHHARKHYATRDDGEYLPLATGPVRDILLYLCQPFAIPVIAAVRFLVFPPIAWVSPRFRLFVQRRCSSMVMDPRYIRPLPASEELQLWHRQELFCFVYLIGFVIVGVGFNPWLIVQGYLTAVGILWMNNLRTLGAHRFAHRGEELTFVDQLLDSVNYPDNPLITELWAPVGLRFHALHHLFPSMPYHSLPEAHRRLMAELPQDSVYRQTNSPGLFVTLRELWRHARDSQRPARRAAA